MKRIRGWLDRPQRSNRDAVVVGLVGGVLTAGVLYGVGALLDLVALLDFGGSTPAWLLAVTAGGALALGLLAGRAASGATELASQVHSLEARTDELAGYEVYAEHLRDALETLRQLLDFQLPSFSLADYIEKGIFEPAQRLLARDGNRGDVRFSVLHEHGGEFVMSDPSTGEPFPALGHSLEGRQKFRLPVGDSFAGVAFRTGEIQRSGDVRADPRFRPHPKARADRSYASLVSIPLHDRGDVDGVLNVIATEADAFGNVERTYLTLLAAVIDVARAASPQGERDAGPMEEAQ